MENIFKISLRTLKKKLAYTLTAAMLATAILPLFAYTAPVSYADALPDGPVGGTVIGQNDNAVVQEETGTDVYSWSAEDSASSDNEETLSSSSNLLNRTKSMRFRMLMSGTGESEPTVATLSDYLVESSSYVKINGKDIKTVSTIKYGDKVSVKLYWLVPNNKKIHAGDQLVYTFPDNISWTQTDGDMKNNSGDVIGTYDVNGNTLTIT